MSQKSSGNSTGDVMPARFQFWPGALLIGVLLLSCNDDESASGVAAVREQPLTRTPIGTQGETMIARYLGHSPPPQLESFPDDSAGLSDAVGSNIFSGYFDGGANMAINTFKLRALPSEDPDHYHKILAADQITEAGGPHIWIKKVLNVASPGDLYPWSRPGQDLVLEARVSVPIARRTNATGEAVSNADRLSAAVTQVSFGVYFIDETHPAAPKSGVYVIPFFETGGHEEEHVGYDGESYFASATLDRDNRRYITLGPGSETVQRTAFSEPKNFSVHISWENVRQYVRDARGGRQPGGPDAPEVPLTESDPSKYRLTGETGILFELPNYTSGDNISVVHVRNFTLGTGTVSPGVSPSPSPAANLPPSGALDGVTRAGVASGWTLDPDASASSIDYRVRIDDLLVLVGSASIFRSDVNSTLGVSGSHGFVFAIPETYFDGNSHSIQIFGVDSAGGPEATLPGAVSTFRLPLRCEGDWSTTGAFWFDLAGHQHQRLCDCAPPGVSDANAWTLEPSGCFAHLTGRDYGLLSGEVIGCKRFAEGLCGGPSHYSYRVIGEGECPDQSGWDQLWAVSCF